MDIQTDITQQAYEVYHIVRLKETENVPLTLLHIDKEYSIIIYGTDSEGPEKIWVLDIGTEKTSREFFIQQPPAPGEVEYAINAVEDALMPLHKLLPPTSRLYSVDESIRDIILFAVYEKNEYEMIATRSNLEMVFSRLAAIINGLPASQDILPATNSFASTLLILREVMHHLGFADLIIYN